MAKNILVVDDVPFVRRTLSELLEKIGYRVVAEAVDGNDAVDKYKQLRPDLVTMDVVMPKKSGIDALKEIMEIDPKSVVVMVSAMDQMNLVIEALSHGAKDYVQKPFEANDVRHVLDRALRGESNPDPRSHSTQAG